MPQILNDIDYIQWKDPRTKLSKNPLLEPWALPPFSSLLIDDHYNPSKAAVPSSINCYNPIALFSLFFTNKILNKMASQINVFIEAHSISEKDAPRGKKRPQLPTCRQELYAYCYGRFKYNVITTYRGVGTSQLVNIGTVQDGSGGTI